MAGGIGIYGGGIYFPQNPVRRINAKRPTMPHRFVAQHKELLLSFLVVILPFLITRLPFFLYYPIIDIDADTLHYYTLVDQMDKGIWPAFIIRTPGYPLFLKLVFTFFNSNLAVVVIQNLITLITGLFFVYAVHKTFKEKWKYLGMLSAVGIGVFISSSAHLVSDTRLLTESLYVNGMLLFFAFLLRALYGNKHRHWIGASVSAAAVVLIRPAGMFLLPVLVFITVFLLLPPAARGSFEKPPLDPTKLLFRGYKKRYLLSLIIPFVSILFMSAAYNYSTLGDFSLSNFMEHAMVSYTSTFLEKNETFGPTVNEGIEKCQQNLEPGHKEIVFHSGDIDDVNRMMNLYYNRNRVLLFRFLRTHEEAGRFSLYMKWRPVLKKIAWYALKKHPGLYLKFSYSNVMVYFFRFMEDDDFYKRLETRYRNALEYGKYYEEMLLQDGKARLEGSGLRIYYKEEYVNSLDQKFLAFFLKEYRDPGAGDFPRPALAAAPVLSTDPSKGEVKLELFFLTRLHKMYSKIHTFLFRRQVWVFLFFFVFIFSVVQLIRSRFHSKGALLMLVLTGSTVIHALGVGMTTFPILRYTYTMEFTYYLSVFLFPLLWFTDKETGGKT